MSVPFYTRFLSMPTGVSKRVVWVVDDSPLDARRARQLLSDACDVEVFPDGAAALERLAATPIQPDVIVLDWVMPGITGVDLCRFLRAGDSVHATVGILLLTAHRNTEQIVEGLSAGANDYLAKPYADAELVARVQSLLRARQLLERAEQADALSVKLLELAPDGLIALDPDRNVKFINGAARTALQQAHAGEIGIGTPLATLLPELHQRLEKQNRSDTPVLPDIKIGERLFSATLRSLPAGNLFGTIVSLRDVTESRRLAARRLDFYSIIAHDLRTPLNTLTLRTQILLEGGRGELSPVLQSDVRKIDENLKALVVMINDFLDLARLDNVSYEVRNDSVDLRALIKETMEDMQPQLTARNLRWEHDARDGAYAVGDARRLQQVIANLIGNAVKFNSDGGTITTRIARIADQLEVSVADTGRGIPAETLPTIFERYTRANNTSDKVLGTGLGLMIVREIVEAHGGAVGVESTEGVGSRFWFRLPARPNA